MFDIPRSTFTYLVEGYFASRHTSLRSSLGIQDLLGTSWIHQAGRSKSFPDRMIQGPQLAKTWSTWESWQVLLIQRTTAQTGLRWSFQREMFLTVIGGDLVYLIACSNLKRRDILMWLTRSKYVPWSRAFVTLRSRSTPLRAALREEITFFTTPTNPTFIKSYNGTLNFK